MSLLELNDVVKEFPTGDTTVRALDRVTLRVAAGEVVAIVGPSGSGKSSLLLVAAGLLAPDSGSARFDGRDLATLSDAEGATYLRRNVGIVLQTFHLLPGIGSVENAGYPLLADGIPLRDAKRRARTVLEQVGLERRLRHRPAELSGGERQRVAIARALVSEPRLLLADEPTASLDSRNGQGVLRLFSELCHERGAAAIIVTHDPEVAAIADRIHTLRDGSLDTSHAIRDVSVDSTLGS